MPCVQERAAFYGVVLGETLGLLRLVLDLVRANHCGNASDTCAFLDNQFVTMNYLHFGMMNSLVVWVTIGVVTVLESYRETRRRGEYTLSTSDSNSSQPGTPRDVTELYAPGMRIVLDSIYQRGREEPLSVLSTVVVLTIMTAIYVVFH